ncbi:MAG: S1 RNA-binding domain-containing protein [Candidatus Sumerlaeaceae bacterium]|nr:S1 RNA-binding domain-containing protein [Candidatus Sumerlaeaceae bacterium]
MRADEPTTPVPPQDSGEQPDDSALFDSMMSNYLDGVGELTIGQVVEARVVEVKKDYVMLDVGDKAEGIVDVKEFMDFRGNVKIGVGDKVSVVLKGRDSDTGQILVSYKQAQQRVQWERIVEAHKNGTVVAGIVTRALAKGVLVDCGVPCFLPASQLDTGRVEDLSKYVGQDVECYVIEIDEGRKRAVLSRRRLLAEEAKRKREEVLASLEPDQIVTGKVKSIVDFGVFVDLGGVDALVPREEIAWEKKFEVADLLKPGYNYKFKVISVDRDRGRVSLSRRQTKPDPWEKIEHTHPVDSVVQGTVTNMTFISAYVLLDDHIEGRIHRDNLSWSLSFKKPSDVLKVGDRIKAKVLGYEKEKRLLELGLKQISSNPWADMEQRYPVGSRQKVKVLEIVQYGAFVELDENTKGLIHVSDMSYDRGFKDPKTLVTVGEEIEAVVLKIDPEQQRINLGIKQLEEDPFEAYVRAHPVNSVVTGTIKSVAAFGVFVELAPRVEGLIHKTQWSRERVESLEGVAKVGEQVTAKVIKIEKKDGKISLSRRAYLQDEERREVEAYTKQPKDATTSLGSLIKNLNIKLD